MNVSKMKKKNYSKTSLSMDPLFFFNFVEITSLALCPPLAYSKKKNYSGKDNKRLPETGYSKRENSIVLYFEKPFQYSLLLIAFGS